MVCNKKLIDQKCPESGIHRRESGCRELTTTIDIQARLQAYADKWKKLGDSISITGQGDAEAYASCKGAAHAYEIMAGKARIEGWVKTK